MWRSEKLCYEIVYKGADARVEKLVKDAPPFLTGKFTTVDCYVNRSYSSPLTLGIVEYEGQVVLARTSTAMIKRHIGLADDNKKYIMGTTVGKVFTPKNPLSFEYTIGNDFQHIYVSLTLVFENDYKKEYQGIFDPPSFDAKRATIDSAKLRWSIFINKWMNFFNTLINTGIKNTYAVTNISQYLVKMLKINI